MRCGQHGDSGKLSFRKLSKLSEHIYRLRASSGNWVRWKLSLLSLRFLNTRKAENYPFSLLLTQTLKRMTVSCHNRNLSPELSNSSNVIFPFESHLAPNNFVRIWLTLADWLTACHFVCLSVHTEKFNNTWKIISTKSKSEMQYSAFLWAYSSVLVWSGLVWIVGRLMDDMWRAILHILAMNAVDWVFAGTCLKIQLKSPHREIVLAGRTWCFTFYLNNQPQGRQIFAWDSVPSSRHVLQRFPALSFATFA